MYQVAPRAKSLAVHLLTHADPSLAEPFGGVTSRDADKFEKREWDDAGDSQAVGRRLGAVAGPGWDLRRSPPRAAAPMTRGQLDGGTASAHFSPR